ncbi:MAG: HTH-type transcriptional regulator BhcR [Rubrimonas sp.]|uniref:HTH-type transcriptional regulator BhcR n=1 Tax=Rubrimonas sp. TaxID=2036015 RepID=UPI002FDE6FE8
MADGIGAGGGRKRGRPRAEAGTAQAPTVQALDRGLALLSGLARRERATLTELALGVGMPASSAHRLLATLQRHGLVEFDEATQEWRIGVEAYRIGSVFLTRADVVDAAREPMRRLVEATGETANLALADGGDVVFVSQIETSHPIRAFFRPGARAPMHASGAGKALLAARPWEEVERLLIRRGLPEFTPRTLTTPQALRAELEAIRARGWALDDEERHLGMRCVAAAVRGPGGAAAAGLSVSGPAARLPDSAVGELGQIVRRAAAEVSALIGGDAR